MGVGGTRPVIERLPRLNLGALVLLVVLVLGAALFVGFGWRALRFPYTLDYGEGPLLDQALRLAGGENIYRAAGTAPPWTISNYPPLYVLLQAPLTLVFGPAYWYGRLISLASTLAAALFAGLIVHTLTADRLAGVVSALVLLMVPYNSYWAVLARIDNLALALSLCGLYLVARWPGERRAIWAGIVLLTAAVYTRQSYGLAAPLAAFVWLLGIRPRHALLLAAGMAALGLGLGVLLNLVTGGGFFFNIVTANVNQYSWDSTRNYLDQMLDRMPLLVLGSALFVLLAGWFGQRSWRMLAPYWIGAALSGLTIGKIGSNVNYLLEFGAAMSLAVGALIAWQRPRPLVRQIALLALAMQMLLLLQPSPQHEFAMQAMDDLSTPGTLLDMLRRADGPVLADEAMGLLPLAGRRIQLQPFELTQLARAGLWDQTPLLDAIATQQYAEILIFRIPGYPLERERWTDEMLEQIERSYARRTTVGITDVYEPREPAGSH